MLRIPHCLDNRLTDGGKVVSPTHPPYFTPQKHYYYYYYYYYYVSGTQGLVTFFYITYINSVRTSREAKYISVL
jgi:hypothetical protein